jgi:hypothetical protein
MSAELDALNIHDKLDRSKQRVQDLGEVFTPPHIVEEMLNLFPDYMYEPRHTFLEPACGNGAFLKAILARKLTYVEENYTDHKELMFHALEAVSSIYGIDISDVNVADSIKQMRSLFLGWYKRVFAADRFHTDTNAYRTLNWILRHNIQVADTLNDKKISMISYKWEWGYKWARVILSHSFLGEKEVQSFDTTKYLDIYTVTLKDKPWLFKRQPTKTPRKPTKKPAKAKPVVDLVEPTDVFFTGTEVSTTEEVPMTEEFWL